MAFFSRERLRLDSQGLDYLRVNLLVRKKRSIPLAEIESVSQYSIMVTDHSGARPNTYTKKCHPEYGLEIETLGLPLRFSQGRDQDAVGRLQERIEGRLRELNPDWVNASWCDDREVLDASRVLSQPPSDSKIFCRREWDHTEFTRRVSADWFTTLLAASVIGIVTLCIVFTRVFGKLDEFSLLYTIPGGLACLVLVLPWISLMLSRRRWVVRPGEITTMIPCFGLGRSHTTEVEWLDRIELRRISTSAWKRWLRYGLGYGEGVPGFELAFVDLNMNVTAVLGPLTEGEARWMAGIIAQVLEDALPKSGESFDRWSVSVDAPVKGSQVMGDVYLDEPMTAEGSNGSSRVAKARAPSE